MREGLREELPVLDSILDGMLKAGKINLSSRRFCRIRSTSARATVKGFSKSGMKVRPCKLMMPTGG